MSVFAGVLEHVRREIAVRRRAGADTARYDDVTLADGSVVSVMRGNLAAAKALLAARRVAERRAAAGLVPAGTWAAYGRNRPPTPNELLARWSSETSPW